MLNEDIAAVPIIPHRFILLVVDKLGEHVVATIGPLNITSVLSIGTLEGGLLRTVVDIVVILILFKHFERVGIFQRELFSLLAAINSLSSDLRRRLGARPRVQRICRSHPCYISNALKALIVIFLLHLLIHLRVLLKLGR